MQMKCCDDVGGHGRQQGTYEIDHLATAPWCAKIEDNFGNFKCLTLASLIIKYDNIRITIKW